MCKVKMSLLALIMALSSSSVLANDEPICDERLSAAANAAAAIKTAQEKEQVDKSLSESLIEKTKACLDGIFDWPFAFGFSPLNFEIDLEAELCALAQQTVGETVNNFKNQFQFNVGYASILDTYLPPDMAGRDELIEVAGRGSFGYGKGQKHEEVKVAQNAIGVARRKAVDAYMDEGGDFNWSEWINDKASSQTGEVQDAVDLLW
ncbi:MAG: hypothetical protein IBX55_00120 [Methyloprofundus sp.]|nr:hypothetical protein [Methyloprofundus sp.]